MIKILITGLLVVAVVSFDYYLIRHGARAALSADLVNVFGVKKAQLTPAGRSQSYYYGKELRIRHPDIRTPDMLVQSTKVDRTLETAEYFLKGWYDFRGEPAEGQAMTGEQLIPFQANPKFLPPIKLSYTPGPVSRLVRKLTHPTIVNLIPKLVTHMHRPTQQQDPNPYQIAMQERMRNSNVCPKVEQTLPGICQDRNSAVSAFFSISDMISCLEFQKVRLPELTRTDEELAHAATDIVYGKRYGKYASPENAVLNFFAVFRQYVEAGEKKLIVEFTHDVFIFGLIRTLLGYEGFRQVFRPHIITPFLSTIRFRVRDQTVRMFLNDRELHLPGCYEAGETVCRLPAFLRMIGSYNV